MQQKPSTQLPVAQSDAKEQSEPAGPSLHVSPVHPLVQTHVPPVPVQAPLVPQLACVQHLESTQLPEEHSVPSVQANPSAVLVLQTVSPGELTGAAPVQAWQASCAELGMLLDAQSAHAAPEAANWPAAQGVQAEKGVIEL